MPDRYKSIFEIKDADTVAFGLCLVNEGGKDQPLVKITYKRKNGVSATAKTSDPEEPS